MPLYEYACEKCGDKFEVMQKFVDEPLTTHEKCGGPVHRLISVSALQFKGSGWYVNDYAKSGASTSSSDNGSTAKSDGASKAEGGSKSDSSSESTSKKSDAPAASTTSSESKSSSSDSK